MNGDGSMISPTNAPQPIKPSNRSAIGDITRSEVGLDPALARRRGAIMGLTRDRSWHFEPAYREAMSRAIVSLGLLVLPWMAGIVSRWLRLDWQLIPTSLRAWRDGGSSGELDALIRYADDRAVEISRAVARMGAWVWACVLAGAGVIVHGLWTGVGWRTAFAPIWMEDGWAWHHVALVIINLAGAMGIVWVRSLHSRSLRRTVDGINAVLIARSVRPMDRLERGRSMRPFMAIIVILVLATGAWWLLACMIAYADVMNEVRGPSAAFRTRWTERLRQQFPADRYKLPTD
jgi:hypothetical protein